MHDLVSYDDFVLEDEPILALADAFEFSARVAILALFTVALGTQWDLHGREFWQSLALAVAMGVLLGLVVASLTFLVDRGKLQRTVRLRLKRVFDADPELVPPRPDDATHRLICSVVLPNRQRVPGILYVRPSELVFQPHCFKRGRWKSGPPTAPPPVHIGPPGTVVLSTGVMPPRHRLLRRIGSRPMPVLICQWADQYLLLRVPVTQTVHARLQTLVDDLRRGTASAAV